MISNGYFKVLSATTLFLLLSNIINVHSDSSFLERQRQDNLRGGNNDPLSSIIKRIQELKATAQKNANILSNLEDSIEKHLQQIADIKNRRLQFRNETTRNPCLIERLDDGSCHMQDDLIVTGGMFLREGLEVEAGQCDNCIVFHDDVIFNDRAKFVDPVVFDDPVKFKEDVIIQGEEVPSSKSIKTSDTTYTSLDFKTSEYGKIKFDQDKGFVVTSKTRFEKNMDIKLPSSPSSDAVEPRLTVLGNLGVAGEIIA